MGGSASNEPANKECAPSILPSTPPPVPITTDGDLKACLLGIRGSEKWLPAVVADLIIGYARFQMLWEDGSTSTSINPSYGSSVHLWFYREALGDVTNADAPRKWRVRLTGGTTDYMRIWFGLQASDGQQAGRFCWLRDGHVISFNLESVYHCCDCGCNAQIYDGVQLTGIAPTYNFANETKQTLPPRPWKNTKPLQFAIGVCFQTPVPIMLTFVES